jgi:hypothetical protein
MRVAAPRSPAGTPSSGRSIRLSLVLGLSIFGAGCARAAPPVGATPALPAITLRQSSEFTIYAGDSIVAIERVDHHVDRIESVVEVIGRARDVYTAYRDSGNVIRRIVSRVTPWTGVTATNSVDVEFRGDSVIAQHLEPVRYTVRRTRPGGVGPMPYIHPSPALLEQLILRALRERAQFTALDEPERVDLRVWLVNYNRTANARVTFVSNRVVDVEVAGVGFRAWMDEFGLMLAEVPSLGWLIQRRTR